MEVRVFRPLTLLLSLSLTLSAHAETEKGLINRFLLRKIPVSKALETFGTAKDRELSGKSINVLIWNIKKTQEQPWQKEFSEFSRGKDLFVIQEAYDISRMTDELASIEGTRWDLGRSFQYVRYNFHGTGTMVGSRAEPEEVLVTHTPDHEPVTNTPKAMTYAKYPIDNNQSLLVVSVHAINFRELAPFKRNMLQIRAEVEKHSGPVLVAGDFNTHMKDRMNYLKKMMTELKMAEITWINGEQRMRAPVTNQILDHGFVRGLSVKHAEVIGTSRGSDHKPLILELSAL